MTYWEKWQLHLCHSVENYNWVEQLLQFIFVYEENYACSFFHTLGTWWASHDTNTIPWSNRIIKIISQNHFPKANAKLFLIFSFYF